jgi:hypothetical protein
MVGAHLKAPIPGRKLVRRRPHTCIANEPVENNVKTCCNCLFPYEWSALIAALRRDVDSERRKAERSPQWHGYHLANARMSIRLIEAFGFYLEGDAARSFAIAGSANDPLGK